MNDSRYSTTRSIGDLIGKAVSELGIRRKLDEARMIDAWAEVAGPKALAVTDAVWVKGSRLFIKITSSAWRHELHLQREAWRDKLNEHLGFALVSEVVFR
jgi:predicted nucleic acid-binding Zn ribbon protein